MAIIGSIMIRMGAQTDAFRDAMNRSADAIDRVSASAERAQAATAGLDLGKLGAAAGGSGGGASSATADQLGSQFDLLAGRISGAMQSALAPLGTFAASFGRQFSQVGGTVIETSKRVAAAAKATVDESNNAYLKELKYNRDVNEEILKATKTTGTLAPKTLEVGAEWKAIDTTIKLAVDGVNKMTASIALATNQLDRFATKMTEVAHAGKGPQLKMFDPSQLAEMERHAAAAEKGGPKGPRTYHRDAQGKFSGKPLSEMATAATATAVAEEKVAAATEKTNAAMGRQFNLASKLRATPFRYKGELGDNAAEQVRALFDSLRESNAMSKKVAGSLASLAKSGLTGFLNRAIQEVSLLGSQFRMLRLPIGTATSMIKGLGTTLSVGLGLTGLGFKAVQAGVGFLRSGIKGASDLNETVDKSGHVFGKSASIIVSEADRMAQAFGTSKTEFIDGAVSLGRFGKAAGLSQQASAGLGVDLAKLSLDLSSIENISAAEAMGKMSSAIAGQTETLRKHGALLSEERIKQEAVDKGWVKSGQDLSEQTKVMARISVIYKDLSDAQGNLAATADSPANAMRRVHGQMSNLATDVGKLLLPAVSGGLEMLSEGIGQLRTAFESGREMISSFASSATSAFEGVSMVFRNLPDFAEIAWLKIREGALNVIATIAVIPANLGIIASYIAGNWKEMIVDAVHLVGAVFHNLGANIGELANSIYQFLKDPTQGFQWHWTDLLEGFKATAAALPALLKPELVSMQSEIDQVIGRIGEKEASRTKAAMEAANPKLPDFDGGAGGKKKHQKEDKDVGALEFGSKEAASAIAKFRNGGTDAAAKQTATNTAKQVSEQRKTNQTLQQALAKQGQPLSAFSF